MERKCGSLILILFNLGFVNCRPVETFGNKVLFFEGFLNNVISRLLIVRYGALVASGFMSTLAFDAILSHCLGGYNRGVSESF